MDPTSFVLFGATGDLAKRKIYPALYNLFIDHKLPESFSIIGLGRRTLSDEEFHKHVEQSLITFSRRSANDPSRLNAFLQAFRYRTLDVNHVEDYRKLLELVQRREKELNIRENRMFYLSVAPEFFGVIASNINESGLGSTDGWKRLIIEKPFGRDLESARYLNEQLSSSFEEHEIYRIDHYLGKPMIQNLEILESSNPILKALWSNHYIANVQITASETVGVEERAGYYDHAGAIRDMFQNHMLQILMMFSMQLPKKCDAHEVRFKKRKVMESLRLLQKEDISHHIVRGQYTAGEIEGKHVPGYTQEPGVAEFSTNDTFIAARLWIDDFFWSDVPFYIRTGKRMKEKSTRIVVEFKEPLGGSSDQTKARNLLVIDINPNEGIFIQLNRKDPLQDGKLEPIRIHYSDSEKNAPEAYETLIFDAIRGDSTFFVHWDEVELSWKWVQPILDAFEEDRIPLQAYPAGSNGPAASDQLLEADGYTWWLDSEPTDHNKTIKGEEYEKQLH
ncbi:glucose-6-phosphate dehydrogenase [Paenibacillus spongiae]|uniref:Glucose-6-phosphate 1-dehydrogenase n=1 Tax=Paenibacillus spongiae TaxID=2909671 RepID=A0ABY5S6B9_9BACL|nr:glucose-6-phosphate dehydrogenase [Paenibacillus spongiae]UVI29033.1 glucose-6-phosphate dehydrogenase [Paenibacillus spongiae]